MTTVRKLQLAANAGEPDSVLARRIDVVAAAVKVVDAWSTFGTTTDLSQLDELENKLTLAVRRYKSALKNRGRRQC
jgi:hypothetical protein